FNKGNLPTFSRLAKSGVLGHIQNRPGLTGSTWPDYYTGCDASEHGYYYVEQIVTGTYELAKKSIGEFDKEVYWKVLSDQGKKVIIIDPNKGKSIPVKEGITISNFGLHDPAHIHPLETWPEKLAHTLVQTYGKDPMGKNDWGGRGPSSFRDYAKNLRKNIDRKYALTRDLLVANPWDFASVSFDDFHQFGHLGWHLIDNTHPRYDPEKDILSLYHELLGHLDKTIEKLIADVPEHTKILLYINNGLDINFHPKRLLDTIIAKLEAKPVTAPRIFNLLSKVYRMAPLSWVKQLDKIKLLVANTSMAKRRAAAKAFDLSLNEDCGGIRINLKGREPHGIIEPGKDYDEYCKYLIHELSQITN